MTRQLHSPLLLPPHSAPIIWTADAFDTGDGDTHISLALVQAPEKAGGAASVAGVCSLRQKEHEESNSSFSFVCLFGTYMICIQLDVPKCTSGIPKM